MFAFPKKLAAVLALAALSPTCALAQFAGDAFFATPSAAIPSGSVGKLSLNFFSAASPFGVAHVTVSYDPAKLELVDVTLPGNAAATLKQEVSREPGLVKMIVVNPSSLTQPIGTVVLAELSVRPLGAVGSVIPIVATQVGARTAAVTSYPSHGGANAEVVVTAPVTSVAGPQVAPLSARASEPIRIDTPDAALLAHARRLAPAGGWVELAVVDGRGGLQRALVKAPPDPHAASD
jgi:hypothetical protein